MKTENVKALMSEEEIDGVLVVLPNFGDEKGVTDALKMAELNVPVLIQGYPDDLNQLGVARRRDSFCGKISVCNNLVQAGIKFSLTEKHVSQPTSASFRNDLVNFLKVCQVVNGLRGVRLGAVGARPGACRQTYGRRCGSKGQARRHQKLCAGSWRARGKTGANGQIGRCAVALDGCPCLGCHGHSMLDLGPTKLWLQCLHADEHDE